MRTVALALAAAGVMLTATSCGGPNITAVRLEDSIAPVFAHLYARQQQLLGHGGRATPQASATCHRSDKAVASSGAGDDWSCALLLQLAGPSSLFTYEVSAKANGCYEADGPPAVVGGRTLTTTQGSAAVNPLFAFDGCFDTT